MAGTRDPNQHRLNQLLQRYSAVQLATLVDSPPDGPQWLHETKFDGYRLLGYRAGGAACLRTRNGKDWTNKFPHIHQALKKLRAESAVLDMEAVVLDADSKSSFQALQAALGDDAHATPIIACVFDILYLDGNDLTGLPLIDRKQKLMKLLGNAGAKGQLRYSQHRIGQAAKMYADACKRGWEGIISKQADAPYRAGRQNSWLKIKCSRRQEFVILGYSDPRAGERALGALYLGYYKDRGLRYAGKVGTGFSMQSAQDLVQRFEKLKVKSPVLTRTETGGLPVQEWQSIHWIKPVLLGEVAFTEWTQDGRIRHPSFQGLRGDKSASEVKKETPMATSIATKSAQTKSAHKKAAELVVHDIAITHPDRAISDTGHITKGELAEYYGAVAPLMLPSIARHPLSLLRCPEGIDGQCFYQRNPGKGLGPDVHPFPFRHKGKSYEYLFIDDEKGLLELIQMGAIEIHPWGASIDTIDCPDRLIFDLDPAPDVAFDALKLAAADLRQRLRKKGLESWVKTTGGKGLHVIVALASKDKWADVKAFAASVASGMVEAAPDSYIATMSKAKRAGKIFIDYFRNDYTATAIADFAVRARPGAPVAVPLEWTELKSLKSAAQFSMKDVLKRIQTKKPSAAASKGQRIPKA
jgi:bifunctional non-homologous end joining protein LigD